jgi:hypothetical protein
MSPKRASAATSSAYSPFVNALLIAAAAGYAVWLLVMRGRLSWPPSELITSAYTLAGCLALVGPIVLARREADESGLGDILWLTGGSLIWVFDLAALVRGELRIQSWPTPLGATPMGLTMLAVLFGAWRSRSADRGGSWSWTNVIGWILGIFWILMALVSLVPGHTAATPPR